MPFFSFKRTMMKLTQKRVRQKMIEGRRLRRDPVRQKNVGVLELDGGRDAALLPVVDALNTASGVVPKQLGELSGTTELIDESSVCLDSESFLVHASLNTTFKQKSNALLNNEVFKCANITRMHETMKRLYEAAETLHGITGQSAVANFLNESPQLLNNWERRGISKSGAFKVAHAIGCSVIWLVSGAGRMADTVNPHFAAGFAASAEMDEEDSDNETTDVSKSNENAKKNSSAPYESIRYSVDKTRFRRVFVVGKAQGGMPERIWTDGDYPVGATDKYAEIATSDPHAFLTPIVGHSMAPRYNPGEFALVEPATEPELEDDVLVRLTTGETMLKRLLARRGGIRLGSYNEPDVRTYQPEEITWMYYVAHPVPARKIKQRI
jgi:phage repressor protein C with HTH and peptisase S24 domain